MRAVHGTVGLSESIALDAAVAVLQVPRQEQRLKKLVEAIAAWPTKEVPGLRGLHSACSRTRRHAALCVFDEDFLGEPIEVDEDVDPDEIRGQFT